MSARSKCSSGRHDVEHGELLDPLGMIERQAMRDAGAAVVRADQEALMPEVLASPRPCRAAIAVLA